MNLELKMPQIKKRKYMHVFGGPPIDENPHANKHQRVDVVKNLFSGMKLNKFGQIDQQGDFYYYGTSARSRSGSFNNDRDQTN